MTTHVKVENLSKDKTIKVSFISGTSFTFLRPGESTESQGYGHPYTYVGSPITIEEVEDDRNSG